MSKVRLGIITFVCLSCVLLVAFAVVYFTTFTWKNSTDIHPCEMSYYHLLHFPTTVYSSTSANSPTHDSQLHLHPPLKKKKRRKQQRNVTEAVEEKHIHLPLYSADSSITNHSIAESVDESHAAGYRLFRYSDVDDDSQLHALPVVFLHGSSGDYKQARSLFSRLDLILRPSPPSSSSPSRFLLDYFSIDFLEEKTAFSGHLILRQAHYANEVLRTLAFRYGKQWRGAVIVAHSMGGVVAHLLPLLCNALPSSVLALYTLGAPHAAPVLVVDEEMRQIYRTLGEERRRGRYGPGPALLSLAGGVNDFFIEPSLTLLPSPSAVNALSHAVPHVQTAVEHQSLCWCKQEMEAVANSIIRLTNNRTKEDPRTLFYHPLHILKAIHREISEGKVTVKAVEVQVRGRGQVAQLPEGEVVALMEGKVIGASLCDGLVADSSCQDVTEQLSATSTLYRDELYPPSPHSHSARHALLLNVSDKRQLHLLSSPNAAEFPMTLPSSTPHVLSSSALTSSPLPPGVYHWSAFIPSGVDRYYTFSSLPSAPPPFLFLHFSSIALDPTTSKGKELDEDTFISDAAFSTVIRYYRRPYDRRATALLVVGGEGQVELNLSFSLFSYLRTLFLQLPVSPHCILSAFLCLLAWQHHHLRVHRTYAHLHRLPSFLSRGSLTALCGCLILLFVVSFPGTQFHAEAFLSPSLLSSTASPSLLTMLQSSSFFWRVNHNETGVAGLIIFLACMAVIGVVQLLMFALLSTLAFAFAVVRRFVSSLSSFPSLSLAGASLWLLLSLMVVAALLSHLDQLLLVHFGLSLSSSFYAIFDALVVSPLTLLTAFFVDPAPDEEIAATSSLVTLLPALSESTHLIFITGAFFLAQPLWWDRKNTSQCAYQLACCTLVLLSASLTAFHFLTASSLLSPPSSSFPLLFFPSASPMVAISALHLTLLVSSTEPPVDSPLLQPVCFLLYAFMLMFVSDASMSLQSIYSVYAVLLLVFLPHAIHRCVVMVLDAAIGVEAVSKRRDRTQKVQ